MFASMHSWLGMSLLIFITARHFVNFAPRSSYSEHRFSKPSNPPVKTSSESLIGETPLSTFIPGRAPVFEITSFKKVPSAADCLRVSSNNITPLIFSFMPEARNNNSR